MDAEQEKLLSRDVVSNGNETSPHSLRLEKGFLSIPLWGDATGLGVIGSGQRQQARRGQVTRLGEAPCISDSAVAAIATTRRERTAQPSESPFFSGSTPASDGDGRDGSVWHRRKRRHRLQVQRRRATVMGRLVGQKKFENLAFSTQSSIPRVKHNLQICRVRRRRGPSGRPVARLACLPDITRALASATPLLKYLSFDLYAPSVFMSCTSFQRDGDDSLEPTADVGVINAKFSF
ncbi:hypothetical protein EVAR_42794_1 [Eumeta japonica]|uniref:Uncharacterized protein n=1 Tax=Eumeta variegata TaxID=151549 RepID=A0A4C1WL89_EUMVA|nr:hypothetical protein EVAR_42794_1 [Eumeta japonica]